MQILDLRARTVRCASSRPWHESVGGSSCLAPEALRPRPPCRARRRVVVRDGTLLGVGAADELEVRRLAGVELRAQLDALAAVLADCVDGGASVSYMAP